MEVDLKVNLLGTNGIVAESFFLFFYESESEGAQICWQQRTSLKWNLNPARIVEDKAFAKVGEGWSLSKELASAMM